ncbi:hypothetical protein [Mesorhizobium sp. 8]|uniref:hypothetical protein n=1 Tax=Mesorhizobium sp. 8 TaxID=2584466 RepID=UPI00111E7EED|nr:hypothetical protein [Mesorhizobium sp. 8]QDC00568.1 hypothetical protein FGU64_09085 [Mesorhizobium sp. 8]
MDRENRNAAIAALIILVGFGVLAYWLPTIMLALGGVSTVLAALAAVLFGLALFIVLWLRGRAQRRKENR